MPSVHSIHLDSFHYIVKNQSKCKVPCVHHDSPKIILIPYAGQFLNYQYSTALHILVDFFFSALNSSDSTWVINKPELGLTG